MSAARPVERPAGEASEATTAVAESFVELMRTFSRVRAQFLADAAHNVEWTAQMILKCVAGAGPVRAGAIAEMLSADPSTVSRQVAALVKEGFIERQADPADGRASLLAITPKADEVLRSHAEVRDAHFGRMLADWNERDLRKFAELLSRFAKDFATTKHEFLSDTAAIRTVSAEGKKN